MPCPNLRAASAQRYSRAKSAPRVASVRLDNRKIAFGGGRLAVRGFSHRSVPRGGRCSPRLHEARWRHFGASLLRQRSLSRRKAAHPCVDAGAWNGSEYLPRPLRLASAPACAVPPLSGSPAPQLMRLVRPRYTSRIPFPLLRRKSPLAPTHAENQGRCLRAQEFVRTIFSFLSRRSSDDFCTSLEDWMIGGLGDL